MDEQALQSLLFLAMLVGWAALSFLEAQARKRKQRRRLEEMEEEELRGGGVPEWAPEAEADGRPEWIPQDEYDLWREEAPEPWEAEAPPAPVEARERRHAPPSRPQPRPLPAPRDLPEPGGMVTAKADLPPTELAAEAERLREESRRELQEAAETPEIEEVEVLARQAAPREAAPHRSTLAAPAAVRRRTSPAAGALRRALRGDRQALREAVLYREVLGRPLGSRTRPGGWEESAG